jgi:hypothetical protein
MEINMSGEIERSIDRRLADYLETLPPEQRGDIYEVASDLLSQLVQARETIQKTKALLLDICKASIQMV